MAGTVGAAPAVAAGIRRLPVLALLGANAVSHTGNVMTMLAVPWFVLETTGSAARTGISLVATTLPVVIAGFFGGTLVDRIGYKRMSVVSDVASGATVALIPLLYHTTGISFPLLLLLVFLGALLDAPGETARRALLPDLATMAGMPLERANAATQAMQRGARLAGAPIAGLLIATFGASTALWVDAATFAVSALMVAVLVPALRAQAEEQRGYLDQLRDGLRFIARHRVVRTLAITVAVTNVIEAPLPVAFPVLAKEVYGSATALGLIIAGTGAGSLAGAVAFGAVGHRLPRRAVFIGGFISIGLLFWVLALLPPLPVAVLATVGIGIAAAPLNPLIDTIKQEQVPANLRGRVFGAITAIAWLAIPLGMLIGGYLLDRFGLRVVLIGMAACYLAATVSMLFIPALREMDRPPDQRVEATAAQEREA
jgi:MFS family permease